MLSWVVTVREEWRALSHHGDGKPSRRARVCDSPTAQSPAPSRVERVTQHPPLLPSATSGSGERERERGVDRTTESSILTAILGRKWRPTPPLPQPSQRRAISGGQRVFDIRATGYGLLAARLRKNTHSPQDSGCTDQCDDTNRRVKKIFKYYSVPILRAVT